MPITSVVVASTAGASAGAPRKRRWNFTVWRYPPLSPAGLIFKACNCEAMYSAARRSSAVALPRPRISSPANALMYFRTDVSVTVVFDLGPCASDGGASDAAHHDTMRITASHRFTLIHLLTQMVLTIPVFISLPRRLSLTNPPCDKQLSIH